MTARWQRLRELHAHVCSESGDGPLLCDAIEGDSNEVGVCAAWDALRDAAKLGEGGLPEPEVPWRCPCGEDCEIVDYPTGIRSCGQRRTA